MLLPNSPANMPVAGRDSGVFLYSGWRIVNAEVPYVNFWDHKPPLIYFINALGLALSGNSRWGVWLLELVSLATAAILSLRIYRNNYDSTTAILTTALWLLTFSFMIGKGNLTTEYALPLQFLCLFFALSAENKASVRRSGFLIGLTSGLLLLLKQNTVGIPLAILIYITASRLLTRRYREFITYAVSITAGFLFLIAIWIAYLLANHALFDFWDQAFRYNFAYIARASLGERLESLYRAWLLLSRTNLSVFGVIGWTLTLLTTLAKRERKFFMKHPLLMIGLINLPLEVLFAGLGGRLINHHFISLLPVFSIFTALTISQLLAGILKWTREFNLPKPQWIVNCTLILALPVAYAKPVKDFIDNSILMRKDEDQTLEVIAYVNQMTSPDDTVLALEAETYVNFASKRMSPTRYTYQYPLTMPAYATEELLLDFFGSIMDDPPALIVDKRGRGLNPSKYPVRSERLTELILQIQGMYAEKDSIGPWTIYMLR
jgi:4-amino-4-deoxy-L-arabinose transferase-like glycosyltransferase